MTAYYNEFDKQKAAWLRELIRGGQIATGDVDERSIADVRPDDLRGYSQCHFFAGIGIWSYALRLAGWPDDREVWTGSCPCQPFSAAGKGEAFDDARHLWPEFFRLIETRRPVVCFGEQVASIDGLAWLDLVQSDLDHAGYTCGAVDLCAAGVGAPHRRQRLYWVADRSSEGLEGTTGESIQGRGHRLASSSSSSSMADSEGRGCGEFRDAARAGSGRHDDGSSGAGGMGDAEAARLPKRERSVTEPGRASARPEQASAVGGLEDPLRAERRPDQRECLRYREAPGRDESADRVGERGEVERLAYSDGRDASTEGLQRSGEHGQRAEDGRNVPVARGPVNGFWAGADWVLTRPQRVGDRPGLRPVERGAFPLANGAAGRVGRLRGYGDGIVAQAAEAFIRAYLTQ